MTNIEARGKALEALAYMVKASAIAETILAETKPTDEMYALRKACRYIVSGASGVDTMMTNALRTNA